MGYEIDFLAVGNGGERGGDAIALRFGNLHGSRDTQIVIVIDGGWTDAGKLLADHIRQYYGTDFVDVVISTHPDDDHSNGLIVLLDELRVGHLLMHLPWDHTDDIARVFQDGRVTDKSVRDELRRSLDSACELSRKARRKGIQITEPFQGVHGFNGQLQILGPTEVYYESLLPHFRCTPEPKQDLLSLAVRKGLGLLTSALESLDVETLTDSGETTPENNTSVITLINVDGAGLLFTGDAGIPALTIAANRLDALGFVSQSLDFVQVPHHGSRRNVGPTILNRLVGPKLAQDTKIKTAFCSCPKDSEKHPARKVANAFRRRGAPIYATQGHGVRHQHDAPARPNWVAATPLPFYPEVDDE